MMTSRERVLATLRHQQPDRIPIDLGGMDSTGITGIAYNRLKARLGIESGVTRVYDPYQQVVEVEAEVLARIGADVLPVIIGPRAWQSSILPDGSPCEMPAKWNPVVQPDGSQVVYNAAGVPVAAMSAGSYYFDPIHAPLQEVTSPRELDGHLETLQHVDWPAYWDEDFSDLEARARRLAQSDYALMGNFAVHLFAGGQGLRGYEQFLEDLITEKALAHALLERLTEIFIERYDRYHQAVGRYVQIVNVNDDLGMNTSPLISPALYREMLKPYHTRVFQHIKRTSDVSLFLHTDGSVYDLIPDLIEAGVDILNPVQFTCRDMELPRLKREFGKDLVFWGGGCDTQHVLPFATPAEVRAHVRDCIATLAPGGGFVFNQVHNIQPDVPADNILAMYDAVRAWRY